MSKDASKGFTWVLYPAKCHKKTGKMEDQLQWNPDITKSKGLAKRSFSLLGLLSMYFILTGAGEEYRSLNRGFRYTEFF